MNFSLKNLKSQIFPLTLILILVFSRLIPHPPNFTPIIAAALMSNYLFKNIYISLFALATSMFLSDLIIGIHGNLFVVYFSLFLITIFCSKVLKHINVNILLLLSVSSSLLFFVITNFGFWALTGMYEKNLNGLLYCYLLAIPFFTNTLISTVIFSYLTYAVYNFYCKKLSHS